MTDRLRITTWSPRPGSGEPYRAVVLAGTDLVLTGPEHAALTDDDLLAEARREYARSLR